MLCRVCHLDNRPFERELHPSYDLRIPPIEPDPNLVGEPWERGVGLNLQVERFVKLFRRLLSQNRAAALGEVLAWPRNDDPIFSRLLVWVAGLADLLDPSAAARIFVEASDRIFWNGEHQRDLLLAMANRWNEFPAELRKRIETRLRKGIPNHGRFDPVHFPKMRASSIAERMSWLRSRGCRFGFNVDAVLAKAREQIPDWPEVGGSRAVDSTEGRGGTVYTDKSHSEFADTPIDFLIARAFAAYDRRYGFLERDPYAGLAEKRPLRVLAALRRQSPTDPIAATAWTHFLSARQNDKPCLALVIARRLLTIPLDLFAQLVLATARWLDESAKRLFEIAPAAVWTLIDRFVAAIIANPGTDSLSMESADVTDWFESAWNSAAGRVVDVLFADPQLSGIAVKGGMPIDWTQRADALRNLPGKHGRYALAQFARRLDWLHALDPVWTDQTMIEPIYHEGDDRDAILAGFFSNASIHGEELFGRLKPILLALATAGERPAQRRELIAASLLVTAWPFKTGAGTRYLSDDELRTVIVCGGDAIRTSILRHIGRWEIAEKLTLLRDVWPLELAARSAAVNSRLVSLAFEDAENFAALVDAILPVLSPIERGLPPLLSIPEDKQIRIFNTFHTRSWSCFGRSCRRTRETGLTMQLTFSLSCLKRNPDLPKIKNFWNCADGKPRRCDEATSVVGV
jgi:hypothetical protein